MFRKIFIFFVLFSFLFIINYHTTEAQQEVLLGGFSEAQSPDGFILGMGGVYANSRNLKVGDRIIVRFTFYNPTNKPIKFGSNGVFVGARWNSTTDANNRDFGHKFRNYVLKPKESMTLNASITTIKEPGTWRFWPAYHINRPMDLLDGMKLL